MLYLGEGVGMKVILLKQGVHEDLGSTGEGLINTCKEICSAVVLLKAEKEEEHTLVDTGNRGYEDEIIAALDKQGLKPEDIKQVIITHLHPDHVFNNHLFKNAEILWGPILFYNKSLDVYDKLIERPGFKLIETPGHKEKHISVVVESDKTYVISGDAIQEESIKKGLWGVPQNQDYIDSAKKIVEIADVIIPGHGPIIEGERLEELKQAINKLEVK
ncbi:MBL fold metallo-hydrolase [Candidatus Woesearchaeota archaeon]|nr:MBL fold metallo-hydrolase [Candidatus Woesearchaeota archaeon]